MVKFAEGFQLEVPKAKIQEIVKHTFSDKFNLRDIFFIKAGRFNTTYKLEIGGLKPVILRIAPADENNIYNLEKFLLRREYAIQPFLAPVKALRPDVLSADFTRTIIPRDYMILSYIEGLSGDDIVVGELATDKELYIWKQLSDISEALGNVEGPSFGLPYAPGLFSKWSEALMFILNGMVEDLKRFHLPSEFPSQLLNILPRHINTIDQVIKPKLTHGDLWPKNGMFTRDEYKIIGLLDFERAFWGDPRAEWIMPGNNFAGEHAKKGFTFRCGFFSEHYTQIPHEIVEKYVPKTDAEIIRNSVYLGIFLTQRILESQRFPRNEPWVFEEFKKVIDRLSL